jgi:hypothetical protein
MVVSKGSTPLQALGNTFPFITSFINNMRKIEREMIQAIIDGKDFSKANTRVEFDGDVRCYVYLHGHMIAQYNRGGSLLINHQGWETVTTKSRLNALITFVMGGLYGIFQKDFNWYYRIPDGDAMPIFHEPDWFLC